ncbi:MAG TPA: FAD-dependent oxidoreductase [Gammaproteobacteria bacterium]|nr:FAD-dependent oxidoreductase [Gammaproteobacteria bacterium]
MESENYDVVIIGGGISGCALLYLLSRYSDLRDLCLLEKYPELASVNSHGRNNSQTLHAGDIETNYTLDKAIAVKRGARMVERYTETLHNRDEIIFRYPKMVIGVGKQEIGFLEQRFEEFAPHFPDVRLLRESDIANIEPRVMAGRQEPVAALGVLDNYSAVNFQMLSQSFVEKAHANHDKHIEVRTGTKVQRIDPQSEGFDIHTRNGLIHARFVVVCAGGHSLLFAQQMGHGLQYSCLPIAGSFYYTPAILNGKVYTVQNDKLPFAAIHGDPDLLAEGKTRFGPTALALPMLERYHYRTVFDFLRVLRLDRDVLRVLMDLMRVPEIRNYILKNFLFEIPGIRRRLFLRDARKIVPTLQLRDLRFARRTGGIRPVMIDKIHHRLHLGEAKIDTGVGIVFNMTPSPGATSCLQNGEKDLYIIRDYLGCRVDEDRLRADLYD